MSQVYDVIVIGAGHNGLTCAAYLARAGRKVLVLEQRSIIGGFTSTEETIAAAPGFRFSPAALDLATGNIPPTVFEELGLERHGLRWVSPDPFYSYISPAGASIAFWRDYRRTCGELQQFSKRDAENYATLTEILRSVWRVGSPYLMGHPSRVGFATWWKIATRAYAERKHLGRATRILLSAPGPVLDEWFESPEMKAALACFAIGGVVPIDEPMAGLIMSAMALQHEWGVRRPVGGMGALVGALADEIKAHGGEIRTGMPTTALLDQGDRISGVVSASGEEFRARTVIGAIDPTTLFTQLAPSRLVPDQVRTELRGLGLFRNNFASFRVDIALRERPQFKVGRERSLEILPSSIMLASSIDAVRRTSIATYGGDIPTEIPVWLATPSVQDRSLVPPGSEGDGIYAFVPAVPFRLRDGARWESRRDSVTQNVVQSLEQYAPGASASIVGAAGRSPADMGALSAVHLGHLFHVDMNTAQMGPWRPTPSLAGYRSPVRGLWHTAAGSHPMGTVCGWPGRAAARTLLRAGADE